MNYCRNLVFDEKPNYQYLRELFRRVLKSYHLENDGRYDWMDPSIKKNPSRLPPHAKGSDGNLRQDLLVPANILFRESYKEGRGERTDSGLASYKPTESQNLLYNPLQYRDVSAFQGNNAYESNLRMNSQLQLALRGQGAYGCVASCYA